LNFASVIKGKKRMVQRLLGGIIAIGGGRLPVPVYGTQNRQGPGHSPEKVDSGDDICPHAEEESGQRVEGCSENKEAGTNACALIPAFSTRDRVAQPHGNQREGVSFTKGSRGDWIRTSDLLNPIQAR